MKLGIKWNEMQSEIRHEMEYNVERRVQLYVPFGMGVGGECCVPNGEVSQIRSINSDNRALWQIKVPRLMKITLSRLNKKLRWQSFKLQHFAILIIYFKKNYLQRLLIIEYLSH